MRKWVELPRHMIGLVTALMSRFKRGGADPDTESQPPATLRIAGYSLVLMDPDGQVVWTNEWDTGGIFDLGLRHSMWVFCEFTNHSNDEAEIAEYEIELVGEDGLVVERFGTAFSDSVIVMPGQTRVFSGQWRL